MEQEPQRQETIYGVYDMSGNAHEYVMANYNDLVGNS